jgi:hypothetical protein
MKETNANVRARQRKRRLLSLKAQNIRSMDRVEGVAIDMQCKRDGTT